MAIAYLFVCDHCGHSIEAWDEGNPFYLDSSGEKQYAYHPSELSERCTGNDAPHVCLNCRCEFNVDSREPADFCYSCGSRDITETFQLHGQRCPWCNRGRFAAARGFHRIS